MGKKLILKETKILRLKSVIQKEKRIIMGNEDSLVKGENHTLKFT